MSSTEDIGAVVALLRDENIITEEQIRYAQRIRKKLSDNKSLLTVLKEVNYVDDEKVKSVLRKRRLDVRVGDLLVELGFLEPQDLRMALELQAQDPDRKVKLGRVLVEHRLVDERQLTELLANFVVERLLANSGSIRGRKRPSERVSTS